MQFPEFVADRSPALLRAAWLLTGDWASAEDLVQTALTNCWRKWDDLVAAGPVEPYVRRVVVTTFLSWRRRHWRNEIPTQRLPDIAGADLAGFEDRQSLLAAVQALPPRQRAVVALRYFEDLTEAATADAMGCSVGTVKSHHARALQALRRNLTPEEMLR